MTKSFISLMIDEVTMRLCLSVHPTEKPPTLETLQKVVGGLIEPMFTIPSPDGRGRMLTGYVNEEGLCIGLTVAAAVNDSYGIRPFAGNMVIAALDRNGNTQLLTANEEVYIMMRWVEPILNLVG